MRPLQLSTFFCAFLLSILFTCPSHLGRSTQIRLITFSLFINCSSSWFHLICHSSLSFIAPRTFLRIFLSKNCSLILSFSSGVDDFALQHNTDRMIALYSGSLRCLWSNFDLNSSIREAYNLLAACILSSILPRLNTLSKITDLTSQVPCTYQNSLDYQGLLKPNIIRSVFVSRLHRLVVLISLLVFVYSVSSSDGEKRGNSSVDYQVVNEYCLPQRHQQLAQHPFIVLFKESSSKKHNTLSLAARFFFLC